MEYVLDELDKSILRELSTGIFSYAELAKTCNVTRNTIYRRVNRLENQGVISRKIMGFVDFSKLGLSAVIVGVDVNSEDIDKAIEMVKQQPKVNFIWRTYGSHHLVMVLTCESGYEGPTIDELRASVAKIGVKVSHIDISVGYKWEKINFVPYW